MSSEVQLNRFINLIERKMSTLNDEQQKLSLIFIRGVCSRVTRKFEFADSDFDHVLKSRDLVTDSTLHLIPMSHLELGLMQLEPIA